MASYPKLDWPEGYAEMLCVVLDGYPLDVVLYVTDAKTGAQRTAEFPTINKVVQACEARMLARWEEQRRRTPPLREIEAPRDNRPTYAELKAKYGENWGLDAEPKKKAPPRSLEDIQRSWNVLGKYYQDNPERIRKLVGDDN